jgi:hypothetical protein
MTRIGFVASSHHGLTKSEIQSAKPASKKTNRGQVMAAVENPKTQAPNLK